MQSGREIMMQISRGIVFAALLIAGEPAYAASDQALASCVETAAGALSFSGTVYARHGDFVMEQSFGTADADGTTPISSETRFNIGSINKMFTALAIGRLVDRRLVAFDAPIGRYLPQLKPEFAGITVAELLDHTSGLGDYFSPANRPAIEAAKTATDLLPFALAAAPAFAPGTRRSYSNSGYVVLGAIIEKVSGLSYDAFIKTEILDPVGMANTRLDSQGGATPMSRMSPTGPLNKPRPAPGPLRASPAGGIFSTPSDLSRLMTAIFDGHVVSQKTLDVLITPRPDPAGGPGTVGYGFVVRERPMLRLEIGGGAPGVNADVAVFPQSSWQLIALSNFDPPAASQMEMVLELAAFAADPVSECATALADPKLRALPGMLMMRPRSNAGGAQP